MPVSESLSPEQSNPHQSDPEQSHPEQVNAAESSSEEGAGAPRATKKPTLDATCAEAVDQARAALLEHTPEGLVGEHLGVTAEAERVVSHSFACTDLAYHGWHWSVVLGRAPRSKQVTVNEVLLLPGSDALLPPDWVPWSERLRPGDLGIGDLLPTSPDDPRLVPGYVPEEEFDPLFDSAVLWELGLGRPRLLSREGRADAADRWYSGDAGPRAPIAEVAPAQCATCGFFVALAGSLGGVFGACSNEFAPDDGRVVAVDHGCGAHSEAAVLPSSVTSSMVVDDIGYDLFERAPLDGVELEATDESASPGEGEAPALEDPVHGEGDHAQEPHESAAPDAGGDETNDDATSPDAGGGAAVGGDSSTGSVDEAPSEDFGHS